MIRASPDSYQIWQKNKNEAREPSVEAAQQELNTAAGNLLSQARLNEWAQLWFWKKGHSKLFQWMLLSDHLMYFYKVNNSNKVWNQIFGLRVKGSAVPYMRDVWLLPR